MYILTKENVALHWWGDALLLIKNQGEYYLCEDEETFFIFCLQKSAKISTLISLISEETGENSDVVRNFVDIFMQNFREYFFQSTKSDGKAIKITGKRGAFYPLELHVSLTNACVQKCRHCYKCASELGTYINAKQLVAFLDMMGGFVPYLTLSGGEPLLHPDFKELVNRYKDIYNICIMTSGFKIDSSLFETIRLAKRGVVVSIYSSEPTKHDEFVGVNGSFYGIMQAIDMFVKEKIHVGVTTILHSDNGTEIKGLISVLSDIGVHSITVGRMTSIGRAKENGMIDDVTDEELQEFFQELELTGLSSNVTILESINNIDDKNTVRLSPFNCTAGTLSWSIYEDGQIQPCGICAIDELSMGTISYFDPLLLHDRSKYNKKISEVECIKALRSGHACPFRIDNSGKEYL